MTQNRVPGLRMFLSALIDLISEGKTETCTSMEEALSPGVASKLCASYRHAFEKSGFDLDNIDGINEYYKQWTGVANGEELRKYACKESEGLQLLVKLALNEIF